MEYPWFSQELGISDINLVIAHDKSFTIAHPSG